MINLAQVPDEKLSQTFRMMKREIGARGWSAELAYIGSVHCFIDRGDGNPLHVLSATPPTTSYAAGTLANDKYGTYELLKTAQIPQLATLPVYESTDIYAQEAFLVEQGKVVVKPMDGAHGKGITVNVDTMEKLTNAVLQARAARKSIDGAIVQRQYAHEVIYDVRILCIDYEFAAAIWRVPARVFGDGTHTIKELILAENATERRGRPYYADFAEIDIEKAAQYLGEQIDTVPSADEEVSVLGIANYGAGGETIDITDDMPDWLIDIAKRAARTSGLPVAGIDFMLAGTPTKQSSVEELDPALIEINKCPLLAMHDAPTSGKPRGVVAKYIDYLAGL